MSLAKVELLINELKGPRWTLVHSQENLSVKCFKIRMILRNFSA